MHLVTTRGCFLAVLATACWQSLTPPALADDASIATGRSVIHRSLDAIDLVTINKDLKVAIPTVDVAIYLGETDGKPHGYVASPDELVDSFKRAKAIFATAGVQLKLLWVKRAVVPASWLAVQANDVTGFPAPPEINTYVGYRSAG
ncbi:MAG TPA: hypothetical protein DCE43_23295, partial [Planctomycetaceae bacterium]|nr:hypothetical protein [Planctomycetaceae bacterium]